LLSVFVLPKFFKFLKKYLRAKEVYFGVVTGMILLVAYFAEISGIHGAIGALLLGIAVSRMDREEYREISKKVSVLGYGIFIPIFFAGIGLHFTPNFFDIEWWVIAVFLGIIVGVKFGSSYIAVRIAKMKPASTVAYGVMSKGAVDLALMLSLLEFDMLDDNLFSLLVFGTLLTMIISSVELQRRLKKVVQIQIGVSELSLPPKFFRKAVSDLTAEDVLTTYEKIYADISIVDAQKHLEDSPVQGVLVFDRKENIVGIISKKYLQTHHKKKNASVVADVMYKKFPVVIPNDFIFSVIQKMNSYPFDIIPITFSDHENEVVGAITNESILASLDKKNSK
jgi:Kef-type K+ transport system membrane component KefB